MYEHKRHLPVVDRPTGIAWRDVRVEGRTVACGVAGRGAPVVFLHGWGLTHRAYGRTLLRLADNGVRVLAPALPGFGGTVEPPPRERDLAGYARWLGRFLDAVGIDEPVTLVGHSFGGGVAIQAAHDLGDRVARLVLINSVGGAAWSPAGASVRPIRERPLWDWGAAAVANALARRPSGPVLAGIAADAVANVLRNPVALWRIAHLARTADLTGELGRLADRELPVTLLWGRGDTFIPRASFEALCARLRDPRVLTVPGTHGWLIDDPDVFGAVMATVLDAGVPDGRGMTRAAGVPG